MAARAKKTVVAICSSQKAVRVPRKKLAELIAFVARRQGAELVEVDLAVVGREEIAALNRRWLRRSGPTDVLSFDLSERNAAGLSAQIIVCGDVAAERAARRGAGVQRELMLYVVHGLLHLMGCDDTTARSAEKMHAREEELIEAFARARKRRS